MNIKETEQRTGMTRANIRYYEAEGLISPQRKENSYREYTPEDVDTLLKIRLLRSMGISLEEIRQVRSGALPLPDAVSKQQTALRSQREQLDRVQEITRQLLEREECFENLNAAYYLHLLETGTETLKSDTLPRLNLPWRRYWARMVDLQLYALAVGFLIRDFLLRDVLLGLLTFTAMLLTEPLLLYVFGTTPGKAIFGIRVLDGEEGRLGYGAGLERTWMVLLEGMALNIPLIGWYFQYRCLQAAENGEPLSWEQDSELTYRDDKLWRNGLGAAVYAGLLAMRYLLTGGI